MDNFTEIVAASRKALKLLESVRNSGGDTWDGEDETVYQQLLKALPPE